MSTFRSMPSFAALPLLLILMSLATGARAAGADSLLTATVDPPVPAERAHLILDNREIVEFRASFRGYSAAQRAESARERLRDAIHDHPRNDETVNVSVRAEGAVGFVFSVDNRWVFGLVPGDTDRLSGETLDELVARTKSNLETAVAASLEQRTTSRLIRSIVLSVVATILLVILLRGLAWLTRKAGHRLHVLVLGKKAVGETHVPMVRQITSVSRGLLRTVSVIIGLVLVDIWLTFVLKQFPYTYPWGDQIDDFLIRVMSGIGLAMLHAVPKVAILAIILLIGRFVDRWVRLFFAAVKEGRIDPPLVDADTAIPVQRLVILFVWVVTIAIAYPFIPGSQGVAFKGLSVLLGVMLSLGSSNVVSQAASGYMIMFSKALRTNDYVRIGDHEGTITSIGMLSTKLRTARDEEINVPNAVVVGSILKNYTRLNRDTGAPVTTAVTIGYSAPWRQVHAMLLEAAAQTRGLRKDPAPMILQTALSDFYVEYTLFARLEVPQSRAAVLSELHANIQDIFNVNGVQIMSPHYEGDPDDKVWVPKDKWYTAPADEQSGSARVEKSKGSS